MTNGSGTSAAHLLLICIVVSVVPAFFINVFPNTVDAATVPVYERLEALEEQVDAPTAVALDHSECIFVAESIHNRVLIYSQSGEHRATITGLGRPISVAVDEGVRVYIGNKDRGNVEVYDSGYRYIFKLGSGDGEFRQPNDIATSGGSIYVVDKGAGKVKIYNTDGSYRTSIGSPGSGEGELHNPTSIAIDEAAGELIVLDHQLTKDMFGSDIEGARIQVFDMEGVYKRGFSRYGNGIGEMFRPQHVTVDLEGRLYVTDSFHNVVLVYDGTGTYLGDIYDVYNPMRTPIGITIGASNRLYIASLSMGRVEVYGIDGYEWMGVAPQELSYQGQAGGSNPETQSITASNRSKGTLNWSVETGDGWITVLDRAGSVHPAGESEIEVGINLSGLAAGTYKGSIRISSGSGATEVVNVSLEVLPAPELSVAPGSLSFRSTNGSVPSGQQITVTNAGAGELNWTAVTDRSWIELDRAGGRAPSEIVVRVETGSLAEGLYTGSISVTGEGGGSPAVTGVTLNILEVTGQINVTTSIAGGVFTINGPDSYSGSGGGWTKTGVPVGTYAIVYGDVEGYRAPSSQVLTLEANGTISFYGEYTSEVQEQSGKSGSIIVGAGPGEMNAGVVKVFRTDGTETGNEFRAHGYGYGVNVAAGDIDGDGEDEIITGPGPGAYNPAEIRVYDKGGNEHVNMGITAFSYMYGVNVGSGDFNGDGVYEVVAGAGEGPENPSEVKVYVYDAGVKRMVESGIEVIAYETGYGVRAAAGDLDGDGIDELITASGAGGGNRGVIKIWEVDTSGGAGYWRVELSGEYTVDYRYGNSVSIASGDLDGDGSEEVITGAGPHPRARDEVRVYERNGELMTGFRADITRRYGGNVGSGDLDNDGVAEIVVGAGPGARNRAVVKIFDANGLEQARFKVLNTRYGVNVAVGKFGL